LRSGPNGVEVRRKLCKAVRYFKNDGNQCNRNLWMTGQVKRIVNVSCISEHLRVVEVEIWKVFEPNRLETVCRAVRKTLIAS